MSDIRWQPDLHVLDERAMLASMLDWYRDGVVLKARGLAQELAVASPVASGTTVAGLVKHLAYVEDAWFTAGIAGLPEPEPWASAPFDDDPDWEWRSARDEPLEDSLALYLAACARSREVSAGLPMDATAVTGRGRTYSLRFAYLHLVEETARHLGHLDVVRELADGVTGD